MAADEYRALGAAARQARVAVSSMIQLAWGMTLAHHDASRDVVFGTVVAGRPAELEGYESMIGLFINTLPVRFQWTVDERLSTALRGLQGQLARLQELGHCRLADIQRWSGVPGGQSLFDTLVLFENYPKDRPVEEMCKAVEIHQVRWFERTSFPLVMLALPEVDGLRLRLLHDPARVDRDGAQVVLKQFAAILRVLAASEDPALGEISPLDEGERQRLITAWTSTGSDYPKDQGIHGLFAEIVQETPDAIAVVAGEQRLTYGELDARSDQVAELLWYKEVEAEARVGVLLERGPEALIAFLGVLKAGGAYVPLDPRDPDRRLESILRAAGVTRILTDGKLGSSLPAAMTTIDLAEASTLDRSPAKGATRSVTGDQLAYVMFTSGSTGEPKAIAIPHRAVVRLVRGSSYVRFDRQQVFLLLAPLTFDASTFEIWGALLNGAKLIIHPEPLPTVRGLEKVIRAEGVTTLWLTAGLFHQFVEDRVEALAPVRQLLAGGDVVQAAPVKKLLRQSGQRTFVNGYGPTENTTFSCCHAVSEAADLGAVVPIGTAISNTTTYVLDESLQPTPIGVPGELFVGGDGLARGYWARPDLTAVRFLPDPFAKQPGARMYRTGDLVRMRPDGQFEFLGRTDRQVKVRGYRIEPGEIESVMAELDEVKAAAVVVDDIPGRGRQLVAFWVPEGPEPSPDSLRLCLEELLPSYLMPAKLVALDELPLTRNGKVAYEKLLALENEESSSQVRHQTAGTETEKAVARIWCEVLEREEFDLNENFFDVGGQSLLLIRVHERLEAWAGRQLPLVDLFQYTTIRSLSSYLDGASEDQLTGDVERRHEGSHRRSQLRARRRGSSSDQHD